MNVRSECGATKCPIFLSIDRIVNAAVKTPIHLNRQIPLKRLNRRIKDHRDHSVFRRKDEQDQRSSAAEVGCSFLLNDAYDVWRQRSGGSTNGSLTQGIDPACQSIGSTEYDAGKRGEWGA